MHYLQTSKGYANLLLTTALEFYQTYVVIEENKPQDSNFLGMKHYLLCHALELALKSWLVDTGNYNEVMLKREFGHNLEQLANAVKREYDEPIPELDACSGYIQVLNPDYKSKGYEYPINFGRFIATDYPKFSHAVQTLLAVLHRSINSYHNPAKPIP